MWEDDEGGIDSSLKFSFRSTSQIEKERVVELSKKAPEKLRPEDVFAIIDAELELKKFIPAALKLIERKCRISFEDPYKDAFSILDDHVAYFSQNADQRKEFEKLKLWRNNRGNCISPKTGKARKSYDSEACAIEEARFLTSSYGEQYPVRCDSCGEWHLMPASRHTPSKACEYCTDGDGNGKQLYFTKDGATKRAKIISEERGLRLDVYECPHAKGWHLTKG